MSSKLARFANRSAREITILECLVFWLDEETFKELLCWVDREEFTFQVRYQHGNLRGRRSQLEAADVWVTWDEIKNRKPQNIKTMLEKELGQYLTQSKQRFKTCLKSLRNRGQIVQIHKDRRMEEYRIIETYERKGFGLKSNSRIRHGSCSSNSSISSPPVSPYSPGYNSNEEFQIALSPTPQTNLAPQVSIQDPLNGTEKSTTVYVIMKCDVNSIENGQVTSKSLLEALNSIEVTIHDLTDLNCTLDPLGQAVQSLTMDSIGKDAENFLNDFEHKISGEAFENVQDFVYGSEILAKNNEQLKTSEQKPQNELPCDFDEILNEDLSSCTFEDLNFMDFDTIDSLPEEGLQAIYDEIFT